MYRTILVPLDGSPFSEQALPLATRLAQAVGARLVLMEATRCLGEPGPQTNSLQARMTEHARQYLGLVADRLAATGLTVDLVVRNSAPEEAIPSAADDVNADLIAMATHGRSGLGRMVRGSVAEAVVTNTSTPVLLLRVVKKPRGAPEPAEHVVLVALDGTPFAETALPHAVALAQAMDGVVRLLRVIVPTGAVSQRYSDEPDVVMEMVKQDQSEAMQYLEATGEALRVQGIPVEVALRIGSAAASILDESKTSGVELIVMTTHARTGWERVRYGSVAGDVLRRGETPILFVRPAAVLADLPLSSAGR
ncbi:MAG: universal stress protein [Anaerolineae bacterium]